MKLIPSVSAALVAVLALTACESGRDTPPDTRVAVVNAAPSVLNVDFLRERRVESELDYGTASIESFDADEYDFNVEIPMPASEQPVNVATFTETLSADNDYYFILAETGNVMDPVVVAEPHFEPGSGDSELSVYHAGEALGAVDVYLEAPDADLAAATPLGTLANGDRLEPATYAAGDYRVTLTAPDAPGDVVFESATLEINTGRDNMLVIADGADRSLSPAHVVRVDASPSGLVDESAASAIRVVNGANDRESKDVIIDGDTANPLFAGLEFANVPAYASLPAGQRDIAITPAGNPGVNELEDTLQAAHGGYYAYIFAGSDSDGLAGAFVLEDRRPVNDTARLRVMNAAAQFEQLQVLIVEPGSDLSSVGAQIQIGAPAISQLAAFRPGDYEIALREPDGAVVAGPVDATLSERGIYTIVAFDGSDATSAEIALVDDFTE